MIESPQKDLDLTEDPPKAMLSEDIKKWDEIYRKKASGSPPVAVASGAPKRQPRDRDDIEFQKDAKEFTFKPKINHPKPEKPEELTTPDEVLKEFEAIKE